MNYAVIMAGGSGQRLWPLSRKNRPKQIIDLIDGKSLLQHSVDRIRAIFSPEQIMIVTNSEYADLVAQNLSDLPRENILGEPVGRDTANAIGLAAAVIQKREPTATMAVFSADQIINPIEPLHDAINKAVGFLQENPRALFVFGIRAAYAHTGYGYLQRSDDDEHLGDGIYPVKAFQEKPNKSMARQYIRAGNYCWNSGMFIWRVETIIKHLERFLPHNADRLRRIGASWGTDAWQETLDKEFRELEKISIDYGVMEKAEDVFMCELDCHWSDIGSFSTLAETIGNRDDSDNIIGEGVCCTLFESMNNIALSNNEDHLIATVGVEDLIIVHTKDATLICRRAETDRLKELIQNLSQDENREQFL